MPRPRFIVLPAAALTVLTACAPPAFERLPEHGPPEADVPIGAEDLGGSEGAPAALPFDDPSGVVAVLEAPGDADFFAFDPGPRRWVEVLVRGSDTYRPRVLDPVARTHQGEVETSFGDNLMSDPDFDKNALGFALIDGPATLEVIDRNGGGGVDFFYTASIVAIGPDVAIDDETVDDDTVVNAGAFELHGAIDTIPEAVLLRSQDHEGDVDVFALDVDPARSYAVTRFAGPPVDVTVTDADGVIQCTGDVTAGRRCAALGGVRIRVESSGAVGDATSLRVVQLPEEFLEAEPADTTGANDTRDTAEAVPILDGVAAIRTHLIDNDVDRFSFTAPSAVTVICTGLRDGQGAVGLHILVEDGVGAVLADKTETRSSPTNATVQGSGARQIVLEKASQDPTLTDLETVRCSVEVLR